MSTTKKAWCPYLLVRCARLCAALLNLWGCRSHNTSQKRTYSLQEHVHRIIPVFGDPRRNIMDPCLLSPVPCGTGSIEITQGIFTIVVLRYSKPLLPQSRSPLARWFLLHFQLSEGARRRRSSTTAPCLRRFPRRCLLVLGEITSGELLNKN